MPIEMSATDIRDAKSSSCRAPPIYHSATPAIRESAELKIYLYRDRNFDMPILNFMINAAELSRLASACLKPLRFLFTL